MLRTLIPTEPADRKLSKIETLRLASSYISHLGTQLLAGEVWGDKKCAQYLGNRPLGRKRRKEDNINMYLRKAGCEDGKWVELAQDHVQWRALVLAVLKLRVLLPES
jgi:hypothetical protein